MSVTEVQTWADRWEKATAEVRSLLDERLRRDTVASDEGIHSGAELRALWQASELPDNEAETLLQAIGARRKTVDILRELFMLRRYWQKGTADESRRIYIEFADAETANKMRPNPGTVWIVKA